jgi:hypothetical protein
MSSSDASTFKDQTVKQFPMISHESIDSRWAYLAVNLTHLLPTPIGPEFGMGSTRGSLNDAEVPINAPLNNRLYRSL